MLNEKNFSSINSPFSKVVSEQLTGGICTTMQLSFSHRVIMSARLKEGEG